MKDLLNDLKKEAYKDRKRQPGGLVYTGLRVIENLGDVVVGQRDYRFQLHESPLRLSLVVSLNVGILPLR